MKLITASLLTALVGVGVYLNTLSHELVFDDIPAIPFNKDLRPHSPWTNLLYHDFWGTPLENPLSHKSYRPLCVATFRLNYLLHELEPMGYHLVNILLHGVVCYLYVQLCGLVLSEVWPALIAGLLFAVHPIHTEAVSGVVGRADIMAGLFFVNCILVYHKVATGTPHSAQWLVLCLLLCGCAALSKETGLTAIAVCLTLDTSLVQKLTLSDTLRLLLSPQAAKGTARAFLRRLFILSAFVVGFLYLRLTLMRGSPVFGYQLNPARHLPSPYRQLHWSYLSAVHSWLLLCPSLLIPEYAMHTIPLIHSLGDTRNLATLVTFAAVGGLGVFALFGRGGGARVTLFALSLMVFPYLPASNLFFPVGFVVAERVLYLPSMGLCLLVAHGLWRMLKQSNTLFRTLTLMALVALLLTHSTKTLVRNREWRDELTLYTAALRVTPHNAKMAHNLGVEYSKSGEGRERAIQLMKLAMAAEPLYVSAISDLGYLYDQTGKCEEAEEIYRHCLALLHQALEGNVTIAAGVKNLKLLTRYSRLLQRQTRLSEAERILRGTVGRLPPSAHHPSLYAELAEVLAVQGNVTGARSYVGKALSHDSGHVQSHVAMAKVYTAQGSKDKAERVLREAIQRFGLKSPLVYELAVVLHTGYHDNEAKLKEALSLLMGVIQVQPHNADALHTLGLLYLTLQQVPSAHTALIRAVEASPCHVGALYTLGQLYVTVGECDKARERLGAVLRIAPGQTQARTLMDKCRQRMKT